MNDNTAAFLSGGEANAVLKSGVEHNLKGVIIYNLKMSGGIGG